MEQRTLLDCWLTLYRRRYLVLLVTLVTTLVALLASFLLPPVYEARALFYVPQQFDRGLSRKLDATTSGLSEEFLAPSTAADPSKPYIGMLKGHTIAAQVHADYPVKPLRKLLLADIDFEETKDFMMTLYSRDEDPELAANIANSYVRHLNEFLHEAAQRNLKGQQQNTETQIERVRRELDEALAAQRNFSEKNHLASLDDEVKELTSIKTGFINQFHAAEVSLRKDQEDLDQHAKRLNEEENVMASSTASLTNPLIDSLRNRLADLSSQIASNSVQLGEKNVDMRTLRQSYETTQRELDKEIQSLVSAHIKPKDTFYEELRQEFVKALIAKNTDQAQRDGFAEMIKQINSRLDTYPALQAEAARLKLKVGQLESQLNTLVQSLEQIRLESDARREYVIQVDRAEPPAVPSFPLYWLNAIVGLFAGLFLGIVYAFFLDYAEDANRLSVRQLVRAVVEED